MGLDQYLLVSALNLPLMLSACWVCAKWLGVPGFQMEKWFVAEFVGKKILHYLVLCPDWNTKFDRYDINLDFMWVTCLTCIFLCLTLNLVNGNCLSDLYLPQGNLFMVCLVMKGCVWQFFLGWELFLDRDDPYGILDLEKKKMSDSY